MENKIFEKDLNNFCNSLENKIIEIKKQEERLYGNEKLRNYIEKIKESIPRRNINF